MCSSRRHRWRQPHPWLLRRWLQWNQVKMRKMRTVTKMVGEDEGPVYPTDWSGLCNTLCKEFLRSAALM